MIPSPLSWTIWGFFGRKKDFLWEIKTSSAFEESGFPFPPSLSWGFLQKDFVVGEKKLEHFNQESWFHSHHLWWAEVFVFFFFCKTKFYWGKEEELEHFEETWFHHHLHHFFWADVFLQKRFLLRERRAGVVWGIMIPSPPPYSLSWGRLFFWQKDLVVGDQKKDGCFVSLQISDFELGAAAEETLDKWTPSTKHRTVLVGWVQNKTQCSGALVGREERVP